MISEVERRERLLGWTLAGIMLIHVFVFRPQAVVGLAALITLVVGAILRSRPIIIPRWLGRAALVLGAIAVFMAQGAFRPVATLGEIAAITGAILLLRPVTPARGQWVLLCLIMMLIASILKPYPTVGITLIILDVATILILAEQVYRPVEVVVSFWVSMMRSLRVIIPVGLVVTGIFWFFPNLSDYTTPVFAGFTGNESLNPGNIAEIAQSRRIALTARFEEKQRIPSAGNIYWRGQVLEINEGLRWGRAKAENREQANLTIPPPAGAEEILRYTQDITSNRGGVVPALDHAVFIDAKRAGDDIVVLDIGAAVLSAVGAGPLTMQAASSMTRMTDPPRADIGGGSITLPKDVAENQSILKIVDQIFSKEPDTIEGKITALENYFRESGFVYTRRPGRILSLDAFLIRQRRGFCEHYAAAAANLLRLRDVPSRVVTGFRGGEWNPWLRTITVRDADAHAWVEAWDDTTRQWLRFDPTDFVSPDFSQRIEREMDTAQWPWYRLAWSYTQALIIQAATWVEDTWTRLTSSEAWENADTVLFGIFVVAAIIWLIRNYLIRRRASSLDTATVLLSDLEHRAARLDRERHLGETPLAWLGRLAQSTSDEKERETLRALADCYEAGLYKPNGLKADLVTGFQLNARRLVKIWKTRQKA